MRELTEGIDILKLAGPTLFLSTNLSTSQKLHYIIGFLGGVVELGLTQSSQLLTKQRETSMPPGQTPTLKSK